MRMTLLNCTFCFEQVGFGATPESIFSNELEYELLLESAWAAVPYTSLLQWVYDFAIARYGPVTTPQVRYDSWGFCVYSLVAHPTLVRLQSLIHAWELLLNEYYLFVSICLPAHGCCPLNHSACCLHDRMVSTPAR